MSWRFLPISRFAQVASAWRRLHRKFDEAPLLDPLFITPLIEEFATGRELVVHFEAPSSPGAIGILSRKGPLTWQTFQPANAPLGLWMIDPEIEIYPLMGSLLSALPGAVMLVGLSQVDPDHLARPEPSKRLATFDYIHTARIEIAGSYESYWAARGKNLRHNMKRQRNRIAREGRTTRLEMLRDPPQMRTAVADYARLESSGWKEAAASAVHPDNAQGRFYTKILSNFAEGGEAVVYRFFYDDQLVASDLCLLRGKVLTILKTTHDESQKGTSPAHLMRHEVIKNAFRTGEIERIEFYGPAQDWHLRWTDDVRTMYHLNYYRSAPILRLHGVVRLPDSR